jgi:hypothetical protein
MLPIAYFLDVAWPDEDRVHNAKVMNQKRWGGDITTPAEEIVKKPTKKGVHRTPQKHRPAVFLRPFLPDGMSTLVFPMPSAD